MQIDEASAAMASLQLNAKAEALKEEGNKFFKEENWGDAARRYSKAAEIDPNCACWGNLAICFSKLDMILEMKNAALKCHFADKTSFEGYYYAALSLTKMMKYIQSNTFIVEGLKFHPGNRQLEELLMENMDELKRKEYLNKAVLTNKQWEQPLAYYGGVPPSGASRIPKGTAYSQMARTLLPEISKKIKKHVQESEREEVNALFLHFAAGELKVAWLASKEWFQLEGYLDNYETPVIMIQFPKTADPTSTPMGMSTAQHPKYDRLLTHDEKMWLCILLSQRFLRNLGCQVHQDFLDNWVPTLVAVCHSFALYKHAVDLSLIHADIIFNQNINGEVPKTEMNALRHLAQSVEMTDDRKLVAQIYEDILNSQNNGIRLDPKLDVSRIYGALASTNLDLNNYAKAESFGVASLRGIGRVNWDWSILTDWQGRDTLEHNLYHPMKNFWAIKRIYTANEEAVMCKLRSSENDLKMAKMNIIFTLLGHCAGLPGPEEVASLMDRQLPLLKPKLRKKKEAQQALVNAIMTPTIEQYHDYILGCVSNEEDLNSFVSHCINSIDPACISSMQAAFIQKRKADIYAGKRYETQKGFGLTEQCKTCGAKLKPKVLKECSCKMALYCSNDCRMKDWPNHKIACVNRRNEEYFQFNFDSEREQMKLSK